MYNSDIFLRWRHFDHDGPSRYHTYHSTRHEGMWYLQHVIMTLVTCMTVGRGRRDTTLSNGGHQTILQIRWAIPSCHCVTMKRDACHQWLSCQSMGLSQWEILTMDSWTSEDRCRWGHIEVVYYHDRQPSPQHQAKSSWHLVEIRRYVTLTYVTSHQCIWQICTRARWWPMAL